ncbi:hypothetical protein HJG43_14205 [Kineosporiaceae bacterium SCSIO 59966]|nr:hypothetical protein HJG43_14205 [Kineosporiaceae bacterium SCSIO 59966]
MTLQIDDHSTFQRREWAAQRVGWTLLAVIPVAGLLGLTGAGPLSWTTAVSGGQTFAVDYQRVTHHEADDALTVTFRPAAVEDRRLRLELTGEWWRSVDVQGITPAPTSESLTPNGIVLEWDVQEPGSTAVHVTFRAQSYGNLDGTLAVGADRLTLSQLVLP